MDNKELRRSTFTDEHAIQQVKQSIAAAVYRDFNATFTSDPGDAVEHVLRGLASVVKKNAEADLLDRLEAAESKAQRFENADGMDGAVVHQIRELLKFHNVPAATWIDDHVGNAIAERDAAQARIRALEEALTDLCTEIENANLVPEANCSCHINPPCNDCVDNDGLRQALKSARTTLGAGR